MNSKIVMSERIDNKDRKFGSTTTYYPSKIELQSGDKVNALFTLDQITQAIDRANKNPEDVPKKQSLWDTIFGKPEDEIEQNNKILGICIGWNFVNPKKWNGWSGNLPDCELDATNVGKKLQRNNISINVLLTKKATIEECKKALEYSISNLNDNDLLIVSISGHGGQTLDLNSDEEDGYDEFICAYDGPILDDVIYDWLSTITKKIKILWLCDTCHSGTMNRFVSPKVFKKERSIPKGFPGQLILISGCTESGTSQSTGRGGQLTNAFLKVDLTKVTPIELHKKIVDFIPSTIQVPEYVEYNVDDSFRNSIIIK